jgi:Ca-activated chloride channel family protein
MKHSIKRLVRGLAFPTVALAVAISSSGTQGAGVLAQGASGTQEKPQIFKAGVDVVSLNVTVIDGQNRYVTDVAEEEFSVFEDGQKQELTFFNRTSLPIALSLLIDTSASMETRLPIAQEAAVGFARRLRTQDLAQIVDFDSRVEIAQGFTNSVPDLEKAIRATAAGGSTALHNALYISLKELAKIKAKSVEDVRRRAIIVLSDGEDTSSLVSYEEVMDLA